MLAEADLARYAGQFVWLELNYDKSENAAFLRKYGAHSTPTFFIIDPENGHTAAIQTGAMSLAELEQFLERGASRILAKQQGPADLALIRGDNLVSVKPGQAADAYRVALRLAPPDWPRRELATASLITALQDGEQWKDCAETAATEAVRMKRGEMFGRSVVAGMWCLVSAYPAPWSEREAARLEPLAKEALLLSSTVRDHRDELYRTLMYLSLGRKNEKEAAQWGDRWLGELDAIKPASDEERSAIDIARVESIQVYGEPKRVLPALLASEQAMPHDWNASLRVAQMEIATKNYDNAIAACDRGLSRAPGPAGRSWLLQTKASALMQKGEKAKASLALEGALQAAHAIPNEHSRENNIKRIQDAIRQAGN